MEAVDRRSLDVVVEILAALQSHGGGGVDYQLPRPQKVKIFEHLEVGYLDSGELSRKHLGEPFGFHRCTVGDDDVGGTTTEQSVHHSTSCSASADHQRPLSTRTKPMRRQRRGKSGDAGVVADELLTVYIDGVEGAHDSYGVGYTIDVTKRILLERYGDVYPRQGTALIKRR